MIDEITTKHPALARCDIELNEKYPNHEQAPNGERWKCSCGRSYIHVYDETEGWYWMLEGCG